MATLYAIGFDWQQVAHWSLSSGGAAAGVIPTLTDDAVFDANSISMATNGAAVCASLTSSAYPGVLTQQVGDTLTVDGDIMWAAGTFTGSASQVQCETFSLTGGTWTSGSGQTLLVSHDSGVATMLLYSGGTFNESTGTLKFTGNHAQWKDKAISVTAALSLYNLTFEGGWSHLFGVGTYVLTTSAALTVTNDLNIERTYGDQFRMLGGTIKLEGDLSIPASGPHGYCSTEVHFTGTAQSYSCLGGFGPIMVCPSGSTSVVQPAAGDEDKTHSASALFIKSGFAGTFVAPGPAPNGIFATTGSSGAATSIFEFAAGAFTHSSGTLKFTGNHAQWKDKAISVTSALSLYNLTFEGGWSHLFGIGSYVLTTSAALTVTNDLNIERTYGDQFRMVGGTIKLEGDLSIPASGPHGYCSTEVHFTGIAQSYSCLGGFGPIMVCPSGSTSVVSPKAGEEAVTHSASALFIKSGFAGTFVAPSGTFATTGSSGAATSIFEFAAGAFTHSSGTLKFTGNHAQWKDKAISVTAALSLYNLTFEGGWSHHFGLGNYVLTTSAALTVTNDLTIERTYGDQFRMVGGTITVNGDVTAATLAFTNCDTTIRLGGTGIQTITQADPTGLLPGGEWRSVNTAGHIIQATNVALSRTGQDLIIPASGKWCQGAFDLAVDDVLTNSGDIKRDVGSTTTYTTLIGNVPVDGPCSGAFILTSQLTGGMPDLTGGMV